MLNIATWGYVQLFITLLQVFSPVFLRNKHFFFTFKAFLFSPSPSHAYQHYYFWGEAHLLNLIIRIFLLPVDRLQGRTRLYFQCYWNLPLTMLKKFSVVMLMMFWGSCLSSLWILSHFSSLYSLYSIYLYLFAI